METTQARKSTSKYENSPSSSTTSSSKQFPEASIDNLSSPASSAKSKPQYLHSPIMPLSSERSKENVTVTVHFRPLRNSPREIRRGEEIAWYADGETILRNEETPSIAYAYGKWLKIWIEIGAVLSSIGLFEAQLSSCAYQVLGMAELGFLPKFFGLRSKWFDTPWVAILISTLITLSISQMDFTDIVASANFIYSLGMLLEFAAFLWLRRKFVTLQRPYKVPLRLPGLVVMCLVPSAFLVVIMVIATKIVYLVGGLMTIGAILWYFLMNYCRSKKWFEFANVDGIEGGDETV